MAEIDPQLPGAGKAYRIFVAELRKHLESSHTFLFDTALPNQDQIWRAGASFHTIKGGAGFFGLSEIARIAGELEDILHRPELHLDAEIESVRKLLIELEGLAKKIPDPV